MPSDKYCKYVGKLGFGGETERCRYARFIQQPVPQIQRYMSRKQTTAQGDLKICIQYICKITGIYDIWYTCDILTVESEEDQLCIGLELICGNFKPPQTSCPSILYVWSPTHIKSKLDQVHLACRTQLWNLRNSRNAKIFWCISSGASPRMHLLGNITSSASIISSAWPLAHPLERITSSASPLKYKVLRST